MAMLLPSLAAPFLALLGAIPAAQPPRPANKVAEPSTAGVFPHPDNRHAFVTVRNDNSMVVLDLRTGETLVRVEVQNSPDGVTYSPIQRP